MSSAWIGPGPASPSPTVNSLRLATASRRRITDVALRIDRCRARAHRDREGGLGGHPGGLLDQDERWRRRPCPPRRVSGPATITRADEDGEADHGRQAVTDAAGRWCVQSRRPPWAAARFAARPTRIASARSPVTRTARRAVALSSWVLTRSWRHRRRADQRDGIEDQGCGRRPGPGRRGAPPPVGGSSTDPTARPRRSRSVGRSTQATRNRWDGVAAMVSRRPSGPRCQNGEVKARWSMSVTGPMSRRRPRRSRTSAAGPRLGELIEVVMEEVQVLQHVEPGGQEGSLLRSVEGRRDHAVVPRGGERVDAGADVLHPGATSGGRREEGDAPVTVPGPYPQAGGGDGSGRHTPRIGTGSGAGRATAAARPGEPLRRGASRFGPSVSCSSPIPGTWITTPARAIPNARPASTPCCGASRSPISPMLWSGPNRRRVPRRARTGPPTRVHRGDRGGVRDR